MSTAKSCCFRLLQATWTLVASCFFPSTLCIMFSSNYTQTPAAQHNSASCTAPAGMNKQKRDRGGDAWGAVGGERVIVWDKAMSRCDCVCMCGLEASLRRRTFWPTILTCLPVSPHVFCGGGNALLLLFFDPETWADDYALHLDSDWWCLLNYGEAKTWSMAGPPHWKKTKLNLRCPCPWLSWLRAGSKVRQPKRVWKAMFNSIFGHPLRISHLPLWALWWELLWQLSTLNLLTQPPHRH